MLAINIRNLRIEKDMTQGDLAKKLHVKSAATICMWEKGLRVPNANQVCKLAEALECTTDELLLGKVNDNE